MARAAFKKCPRSPPQAETHALKGEQGASAGPRMVLLDELPMALLEVPNEGTAVLEGTAAHAMGRPRLLDQRDPPSRLARTQAKVEILVIKEEALVQAAQGAEALGAHGQARAGEAG